MNPMLPLFMYCQDYTAVRESELEGLFVVPGDGRVYDMTFGLVFFKLFAKVAVRTQGF
jgi:hypothetical protein